MLNDNPYKPDPSSDPHPENKPSEDLSAGHAAYNIVSDTVFGLNTRKGDNKFQAKCIFVSVLVLATAGAVLAALNRDSGLPWYVGALIGAFAGLIIGVFGSGIYLMVYRAVRHMKGDHK